VIRTGTSGGVFSATGGLTIGTASGTITPGAAGTYTVTLTFAAANGCPAVTATANVTIGDNTPPVLTVPPTANIECSASKLPSNTGQATATDNCTASPTITYNTPDVITPGNCTNRYTITRTWTATDAAGNSSTGTQTINVDDKTPPVIICSNFSVATPSNIPEPDSTTVTATDNGCSGTISIAMINETYTGLAGKPGFCPTSVIRTWEATDACGNKSTCVQTITVKDVSKCAVCQSIVPFFPVILTGYPDSLWKSPNVSRAGICCGASGPPPPRCISFNILLDKDAVGLIFTIPTGAIPGGALYYHIDCGTPQKVGDLICLQGDKFYTLTFCEPGNNPNTYAIQSISGITGSSGLTTRADANCKGQLSFTGVNPGSVTWTVVTPNDQKYLSYLSCTNCLNPIFTPDSLAPATIVYKVCGTVSGSLVCNGQP
ncbi:MAG TPA: hypothetical protein VIH90_07400, partial [Candidatus Saccharimonadales bacterium]